MGSTQASQFRRVPSTLSVEAQPREERQLRQRLDALRFMNSHIHTDDCILFLLVILFVHETLAIVVLPESVHIRQHVRHSVADPGFDQVL